MLRNQDEDADRGVRFIPDGWDQNDMFAYATTNLNKADQYLKSIDTKNIQLFCKIPLALAKRNTHNLKKRQGKNVTCRSRDHGE